MKHNRFYSLIAVLLMASAPLFGGTVSVERAKALGAKFVEAISSSSRPATLPAPFSAMPKQVLSTLKTSLMDWPTSSMAMDNPLISRRRT